jgi:hypothetical protein
MRGVPLIDTAGIEAIHRLHQRLHEQGGTLMCAGVHDNACNMMEAGVGGGEGHRPGRVARLSALFLARCTAVLGAWNNFNVETLCNCNKFLTLRSRNAIMILEANLFSDQEAVCSISSYRCLF